MNDKQQIDKSTSISCGFEQLVTSLDHLEQSGRLAAEFAKLPDSPLFPIGVGKADAVSKKNRWKELVPYDHNRVICQCETGVIDDVHGDYINASFIRGFRNEDGYITTQGPMLGTVEDFWSMVWSENNRLLVMMCRLVERCQNQSYKYWPDVGDCIDVDNITVSTDIEDERGTYIVRKFSLRHSKTGEMRQVTHLQFTAWPDNSLPCVSTLVSFWKTYRRLKDSTATSLGPPLIHCRYFVREPILPQLLIEVLQPDDGSRRSGLLIALDNIISQWEATAAVDIFSCVLRMREDRLGFFVFENEYVYLYHAAVEAYLSLQSLRETSIPTSKDTGRLNNSLVMLVSHDEIVKEYKVLDLQRPKTSRSRFSNNDNIMSTDFNSEATKSYQLLSPTDSGGICVTCVPLQHQRKSTTSGERPSRLRHSVSLQENEIFLGIGGVVPVDCKSSFLVSAAPDSSTAVDFWQMIFDTGCRTIVRLAEPGHDVTQADKWPLQTADFRVSMMSHSVLRDRVKETTMLMSSEMEPVTPFDCDIPSEVTIKMCTLEWSCNSHVVPSCDILFLLFKRINRWLTLTSSSLIAVHCKDGQSTSGHFCAAYNVISSLLMDSSVDVYLTSREVQDRLPQAITQEQYQHLYTICEQYTEQRRHHLTRLLSTDSSLSAQGEQKPVCAVTSCSGTSV